MNKIMKHILRIWITISSLILFAIGWITLAHAQKPAPLAIQTTNDASVVATIVDPVELAPVPSLDDFTQTINRPISQPTVNFSMPRLRTRGS
jgi:hypothetical protein